MTLAAATMHGMPPTTGAHWWSTDQNLSCAAFHSLIYEIPLASGGKGYACGVTGTFAWSVAGGMWKTSLRASAPASGAIGVQYVFYDENGNRVSLDTLSGSVPASGDTVGLALNANQPSEVQLLGATSDAPEHSATQSGSVFGLFLCPDSATCATVLPELMYSAAPSQPWLLSFPIAWDSSFSFAQPSGISRRWSATGINDATHLIAFAIYNQSQAAAAFTVRIYDSNGALAGEGTTPPIPSRSSDQGVGGTRGFLLADIITTAIPAGILKVTIEGAAASASFLQFNGDSAVGLPAYDLVPAGPLRAAQVR